MVVPGVILKTVKIKVGSFPYLFFLQSQKKHLITCPISSFKTTLSYITSKTKKHEKN